MKILVVDDEILARKRAIDLLEKLEDVEDIVEASSGQEAIKLLLDNEFDLVLLDIQMTDMTGFDVLLRIPGVDRPQIIFITAYDQFAIHAFEVRAIDFLLKPYKDDRFYESISRVKKTSKEKIERLIHFIKKNDTLFKNGKNAIENVVIKKRNNYYFVPVTEIKYIISSTYYAEIFTKDNKKHLYRISMSDFIKILDNNFLRISRSTIIHKERITKIVSEGMGEYSIIMKDGKSFSLSKNYRENFLIQLKIRSAKNG
ncbi:MAG: LytTR family DNA-binding domain-containing protein [Bacteroidota bacterium]